MSPNLLSLYLASFACITLLILFAHHNWKTGWVRDRKSIVDDLIALQMCWDESDMRTTADSLERSAGARLPLIADQAPTSSRAPSHRGPSQKETFEFTRQLAGMAEGLRESASVPVEAAAPEQVTVEARAQSNQ
jgi:hypothetical protein